MITIPYLTALTTYFSYGLLFAFGQFRDFFRNIFDWWHASNLEGYAPICLGLEDFYIRRLYLRIQDCFGRPIASAPDAWFDVVERYSNDNNKTLKRTDKISRCLNLGSYNYLGFAAADEYCTPRVIDSLCRFSASTCSTRVEGGTTTLHKELEECVANFVGKPAAVVFGMGYVTNSAILPVIIGRGGLIISDSLNHNSIVNGARGSGATIRVFQHNTPSHLEKVLREQIADGQPRTHRPWKKIIVVVEGIYSMEGELCKLPEIIAICKKYKAYVYLDEAHSIGAVGKTGRGVCELLGVDTADVDIMMGTFTKSFGSCGGYIAGSKALKNSQGYVRIATFSGQNYKKWVLRSLETMIPLLMPIMLYNPAKIPAFSRECLKQNVAVVTVAFPATPLLLARARICISASHTKEDLLKALEVITQSASFFPDCISEILNRVQYVISQAEVELLALILAGYSYIVVEFRNSSRYMKLELIQYLKYTCPAHLYATSISPPAAQQIISSIKVILGEDGSSRVISQFPQQDELGQTGKKIGTELDREKE
ncbi:hypothetical protein GOBAR_DD10104 [Gossypium barbadense]|nr:hypothetical protein GOBAR_DD10104 [Gossypium barbadense]